jgi:hypothetical protein
MAMLTSASSIWRGTLSDHPLKWAAAIAKPAFAGFACRSAHSRTNKNTDQDERRIIMTKRRILIVIALAAAVVIHLPVGGQTFTGDINAQGAFT